jgi:hypothetical protein
MDVYEKTTWVNSNVPAIDADHLNKMEQGIFDAQRGVSADGVDTAPGTLEEKVKDSLEVDEDHKVHLKGDDDVPGAHKVYGTDAKGIKGYQAKSAADITAIHTDGAEEIYDLTVKTPAVNADVVVIEDSEAEYIKKKITLATLLALAPGGGDMLKATYDPNADGVIAAAQLDPILITEGELAYALSSYALASALADYVTKALFDANTILAATTDNTPAALTVAEQTLVGRLTGGAIASLTVSQCQTLLDIIDKTLFNANTILAADDDNTPTARTIAAQQIVGRLTGGLIKGLSLTELQTLFLSGAFPENVALLLPSSLTVDGKYIALESETGTLGETVAFGETIYLKASDGKWWKAKGDVKATSGSVRVGYCCVAGNADASTIIMFRGIIRADALFDTFTISAPVFQSAATAGKTVSTAPTGTANFVVRILGHAGPDGNTVHVNVSPNFHELSS